MGGFVGYNSFDPRTLSFVRYLLLAPACTGIAYYLLARNLNTEGKIKFLRNITACFVLFLFACLAYWYVGKPVKILGTNSFTPRHAFLASVPFSLLLAYLFEQAARRFGKKVMVPLFTAIALFFFLYQYAAYQQKFAHLLYQDMFAATLKKEPAPLPGVIILKADMKTMPKYNKDIEKTNRRAFFDAYWEHSWVVVHWNPKKNGPSLIPDYLRNYFDYIDGPSAKITRFVPPISSFDRTLVEFTHENFDPFGSPMDTYRYFTHAYSAYNPRVTITTLPKIDF